jgi:hypothetical protein
MHCEDCHHLLIDLAYDELDDTREAEVRQHLTSCAACAEAWSALQTGRRAAARWVRETPPPLSASVLAAVQSVALQSEGSASRSTPPADRPSAATASPPAASTSASTTPTDRDAGSSKVIALRPEPRWLDRIATLAARREVAMAAVFLLALGVGVTTLYKPSRNPVVTEEDRARDVIPAVEVNAESAASAEGRARVMSPTATSDSPARTRTSERADNRAGPARGAMGATNAPATAPSAIPSARAADEPSREQDPQRVMAGRADESSTEAAGLAATESPEERVARDAVGRGDPERALASLRLALATATDDPTRARLQRSIAAIEAAREASSAQASDGRYGAGVPVRATGSMRRAVRPSAPRSRSGGSSQDDSQALGFKPVPRGISGG